MGMEEVSLEHTGWLVMADAMHQIVVPHVNRAIQDEDGHAPLRWRALVMAREQEGLSFTEIGKLFGITTAGAWLSYKEWKDKVCDCCRLEDEEEPTVVISVDVPPPPTKWSERAYED